MQKIWHSEFGWDRESLKDFGKAILFPLVEWLPDNYYRQQRKLYERKVVSLKERFIEYLKLKETKKIFALDKPILEKKWLWERAMREIYHCFME